MMLIYLAGPVDFSDENSKLKFMRAAIKDGAVIRDLSVFDPSMAFSVAGKPFSTVQQINDFVIQRADAMIALLPSNVQTLGTPIEIARAHDAGVAVSILTDMADRSWALAGLVAASFYPYEIDEINTVFDDIVKGMV